MGSTAINPEVLADLNAQRQARRQPPPSVVRDLEEQRRLRQGDYPLDTLPGLGQGALGAVENIGQMMSGFFSAVPGAAAGVGAALGARDPQAYTEAFQEQSEKTTYSPRTRKGKRIQAAIEGAYVEYIQEGWGEYVGEQVDKGYITPEEAAYYRTSADALLLGLPIRALKRRKGKAGRTDREVEIDKPLEGEVIPRGASESRVGPRRPETIEGEFGVAEGVPLRIAVREAAAKGVDAAEMKRAAGEAEVIDLAAKRIRALPAPERPNIFRNRQAGAVDPGVLAEGVRIALRPGRMATRKAVDVTNALARQVAFKQVSEIRDIPSPTAKMLADRILPKQDSTIPLEAGFHERVSVKQGEYNTRIDNILAPIRRHVANSQSLRSARLIALPKRKNDALFRGLDTGVVPESLAPATKAIRAILDEMLTYQQEAGVRVEKRSNYIPHMWDHKKIARLEYGRKNGGEFTKFLMDRGFSFEAAQQTISRIIHEEGLPEFAQDTGGRLQEGQPFAEWGRAFRVGGSEAKPAHVRDRTIEASFDEAKRFLVTDLESVLTTYVRKAVEKAEYTRLAGPGEVKLNQTVRQIVEEAQLAGAKDPHKIAQSVYDMFDALQHRFHQIKTPAVKGLARFVNGWEVMAHLGLVSLAQLPETLIPSVKYRIATTTKGGVPVPLKSYVKGMMAAAQDAASSASTVLSGKRVIPKSEIRRHLESIGVVNVSALESSIARMTNTSGVLTSRFIRATLMEAITDLQRNVAADTIQSVIRQNAAYLSKDKTGKKARMYRKELIELGLKPEEVVEWHKAGMPKDHPLQTKLDIALVRGVNNTIIMPTAANAPRWYNNPKLSWMFLFTRFFTAFGNTVIKKVFKDLVHKDVTTPRKLAMLSSMIASVGVAYYTQFLREDISGYQVRDEDDPMRFVDAIDRAGWTGMFTRLYPLLMGEYRYKLGPTFVTNLAGPAATDASKLIEAAKGSNKQKARWMASMTPILNITPETEEELEEFYLELLEEMD